MMKNIRNMRGSHFSVGKSPTLKFIYIEPSLFSLTGMNMENQMSPAPYKISNPVNPEKIKTYDKNELGKESWILGQCPETFKTVS